MNDSEVTKFDDYWWTVTRNAAFIKQYGHCNCPDWEDKWHQDLEDAYLQVQPLLVPVTRSRMFYNLPGNLNPFEAENYHHALVKVLNPPEQWFGKLGMLRSTEYLALKQGAEEEEISVARTFPVATPPVATPPDPLEGVNDAAWCILQAIDRVEHRRWTEIAKRAGYSHDKVRQYSTDLQEKQLIRKTARGFIRLIPLPNECESQ